MKSGYSVEKLIKDFNDSVFPVFAKAIKHIPEAHRKDVREKLTNAITEEKEAFPIEDIRKLTSLKGTKLEKLDEIWIDAIEEAVSGVPELILLSQDETHFNSREGDTIVISVGKFFKRFWRALRKFAHSTGNAFRRMLKKPETEFVTDTREVPFRNIVRVLLLRLKPEIIHWKQAQYRFIARVFETIQHWTYPQTGDDSDEKPEDTSFKELLANLIETYDETYNQQQEKLLEVYNSVESELKDVLDQVGTIELSKEKFSDEVVEKEKTGFSTELTTSNAQWFELKDALILRLELLLNLKKLEEGIEREEEEFQETIQTFYLDNLISGHKELSLIVKEAISELNQKEKLPIKTLITHCDRVFQESSEVTKNKIVDPLTIAIEQNRLSVVLNGYIESVTGFYTDQPEQGVVIEDLNIEGDKPVFDIKQVEWRRFVLRVLNKHIATELEASVINPEAGLSKFIELYQEVIQIIETNLDVIDEVSKKEEEEPVSIALKSLERSAAKVEELEELIKKERAALPEKVHEQNALLIDKLSGLLIKQDVSEIKWTDTQLKVKESAGDFNTKLTVFWAKLVDQADLGRRFLSLKYRQYNDTVRSFLGLTEPVSQSVESTNLATFLYETDQKFEKLPFIYRRLFDFRREIEPSFFIQNPLYFDNCRKALELWKGGFPASIHMIGEKGSGKSTLTRFLLEEVFKDEKIYNLSFSKSCWQPQPILKEVAKTFGLKEAESPEELVAELKKKRKGSVAVLENLQNCYLRNMHGYEAMKSLLYIISESKKEILWVVTCSRYAWDFLNVVFKIGEYFSHSITTDNLNADQMKSLILKRQKASGYQLEYIPDASTQKSRAYKKHLDDSEAEQDFLENKYFEKLTNLAEGNATVGMILWIRSIKDINEAFFTIESLDFLNTTSLDGLDALSQFSLSAFILHDSLNAPELARILNLTDSESEMMISRLASRGLLVVQQDNYYTLNDLVYRQVVRLLKSRNILH